MWTVDVEFDQPIRHFNFNMSGGSFCAIFTLRLTPCLDEETVRFANELEGEGGQYYGTYVEQGVRAFMEQRAKDGRPIGYLRVTLIDMKIHEIDSKPHRFRQAGLLAMEKAFESHGFQLT